MKTLKCEICGQDVQGEDFGVWFQAMHTHWTTAHADVMKEKMNAPKEEGDKWMADAKAKFEAV